MDNWTSRDSLAGGGGSRVGAEVPFAIALIGILFIILIPLPTAILDALLIVNFTLSLMVLLTAASVSRPMEVSVFPSLLLVVTFFRLALNIGTTRLILGEGEAGAVAAGQVVYAFGHFVAGSNIVVGFVVFIIIMVVQFAVITKGSTRISEVAARFTLDAMPGKQLSIDGDLSAGFIDDGDARRLRKEISDEADFYGAMDGASKFVRGEALAGFVITAVNIVGGLSIGILYHGMGVGDAARVFTSLTIGDGLVTQIPALMVSVAAALLVTKSAGGEGLARDLNRQLFRNQRVFFVVGVFLLSLSLFDSGLPWPVLLVGAATCITTGFRLRARDLHDSYDLVEIATEGRVEERQPTERMRGENLQEDPAAADERSLARVRSLLELPPLELEIGYRLVRLVDEERKGDLLTRLGALRENIALELGLVIPPIKIHDDVRLRASEYAIRIRGSRVGVWRLWPDRFFVAADEDALDEVQGVEGRDPSTGESGLWADESQWSVVASAGYKVRRSEEIIPAHFNALIRAQAAEILSREEVSQLLVGLRERAPALVEELVPHLLTIGDVHAVLRNLLREQITIRDLETILEALATHAKETRDLDLLTEFVRRALARTICGSLSGEDKTLRCTLLDPALEEFLQGSLAGGGGQPARLALEPETEETIFENILQAFKRLEAAGGTPLLVCSGKLRRLVSRWLLSRSCTTSVLAYEEIWDGFRLVEAESVGLEAVGRAA